MANKGQKFKLYDTQLKYQIIEEKQQGLSYKELSIKYDIPADTISQWVYKLKKDWGLDIRPSGQGKSKTIDYKQKYEILKKFQDFLAKNGQKKK